MLRVGCTLVAFSPSIAFTIIILARRAELLVIAITAAVMWLFAILIVSLMWSIMSGTTWLWFTLVATATQELVRLMLVRVYRRMETVIRKALDRSDPRKVDFKLNDETSSLAAGVGFGTMHAVVMYGSVLASSGGPATLYSDSCTLVPLVVVSGIYALIFLLMDVIFMVIAFQAHKCRDSRQQAFIFASHLGASYMTLFGEQRNGCAIAIPGLIALFAAVTVVFVNLKKITIRD